MDFSRVRTGEMIAGISGAALFIVMFLEWFTLPESVAPIADTFALDTSRSAWVAFDFIDLVLLLAVVAGVGLVVLAAAQSSVQLPVAASAITAGLGILATLLVLYRVLDPPSDLDRSYGLYLGLVTCAGIAVGGWMAMQEEGTTFSEEANRVGGP